jgi:rhodanese-related sulfurtransferase
MEPKAIARFQLDILDTGLPAGTPLFVRCRYGKTVAKLTAQLLAAGGVEVVVENNTRFPISESLTQIAVSPRRFHAQ